MLLLAIRIVIASFHMCFDVEQHLYVISVFNINMHVTVHVQTDTDVTILYRFLEAVGCKIVYPCLQGSLIILTLAHRTILRQISGYSISDKVINSYFFHSEYEKQNQERKLSTNKTSTTESAVSPTRRCLKGSLNLHRKNWPSPMAVMFFNKSK